MSEPVSYSDPLDLLRRFAPTPLRSLVYLEFTNIVLETNDVSFLSPLALLAVREPSSRSCLWKIVRDVDVCGPIMEASIVMAGNLIVYCLGPACLIGADRERGEILACVGRDVDAKLFGESVVPALLRLTEFVTRKQEEAVVVRSTEMPVQGQCNA